jgi:hypothetical protein
MGRMSDKVADFLREVGLQNASSGTWGIGSAITRATAKATQSLMNVTVKVGGRSIADIS